MNKRLEPPLGFQADIAALRVVSALAVILTHTCGILLVHPEAFTPTPEQVQFFSLFANSWSWHVPVFFMISGALLLKREKNITPAVCLIKYAGHVLAALFVFGIPFAIIEMIVTERGFYIGMLGQSVLRVINGESWDHLWFLYSLLGLYLFLPLFKRYTDSASRSEQRYVLFVLFVLDMCCPAIDMLTGSQIAFTANMVYPIFYFLLGRYLAEETPKALRFRWLNACGPLLLFTVYALAPKLGKALCGYTGPLTVAAASMTFVLFKGISVPLSGKRLLWRLDRLCFGVFIIHPAFMHFLYRFLFITPLSFRHWALMMPVFYMSFCLMSFFASWVMSLIPPLRKYVL